MQQQSFLSIKTLLLRAAVPNPALVGEWVPPPRRQEELDTMRRAERQQRAMDGFIYLFVAAAVADGYLRVREKAKSKGVSARKTPCVFEAAKND